MSGYQDYPIVRGVRIDIHALRVLAHFCDPTKCIHARACCNTYEVYVERGEMKSVTGAFDEAARYLDEPADIIDPFEETEGGHCLNTDEDGLCVFAYRGEEGGVLCSLHSAAIDMNLPPASVKPKACTLWPLFYQETDPPLLTVQNDAVSFPCNSMRHSASGNKLDRGVGEIIEAVFGKPFLDDVNELL